MNEISLKEFCYGKSQEKAAAELGYTQGWISHLLKPGRDVRVITDEAGDIRVFEMVFKKHIAKKLPIKTILHAESK